MKTGGNCLTLQVQQKTDEITEGYEEGISYGIAVVNDGEEPLTEVEVYLEGDPDFSLEFKEEEEIPENTLAPGERWNAVLKMKPGKKAGKYYVTVVVDAAELEETVEQTVRIVVKESEPEESGTSEPAGTPEVTRKPEMTEEPAGTPEAAATEEPIMTPEVTREPEVTEEPAGTPEAAVTEEPEVTEEPTAEPAMIPEMTGAREVTPEPATIPEMTGTPEPTAEPATTPEVTGVAKPEPIVTPEITEEPSGTPSVQPKPVPESAVTEEPSGTPDTDDIIRVDVPANACLLMNPAAEEGQITSSRLPLVNHSGFPLNVEVTRAVVDIRQNGGMLRKDCSLNIDVLRDDAVVLAIRNLKEGVNQIDTSFLLPPENPAYILFSGKLDEGTGHLWEDGDLHASVIFRFSKA